MAATTDAIRQQLALGPAKSRQLVEKTGFSQPTVSRALAELGDDIIRLGAGRSIQYALKDHTRGFDAVAIHRVSESGQISMWGQLVSVRPDGFVMIQPDGSALHSDGLPWWLLDMRPQGFMGRAYAARHAPALGLPADVEQWSDAQVLHALLHHGHDAVGHWLVGEKAREVFLQMPPPEPVDRQAMYPELARAAAAGESPGSSAGGEQPKFAAYTDRGHVLVKYSARDDNAVSERWRDLLLSEHHALAMLGTPSQVLDINSQRFLEVPRFDRVGPLGRVGVFSLRALDAEFVGRMHEPWPVLVQALAQMGVVQPRATQHAALRWAFGALIGNTDMHAGNLSFIGSHGSPYQLSPAYDVLPMAFAPNRFGEMGQGLTRVNVLAAIPAAIWHQASQLAQNYLERLRADPLLSGGFAPCLQAMQQHLAEAQVRIGRLA